MRHLSKCIYLFTMSLVLCVSCSRPSKSYSFVYREDARGGDTYSFEACLQDSLADYRITMFARLLREPFSALPVDTLKVFLAWFSPDEKVSLDTLFIPLADTRSGYFPTDVVSEISPPKYMLQPGVWRLDTKVHMAAEMISGMGLEIANQ